MYRCFHNFLTPWNKMHLIHSVANKTLGKKPQDAKLIKWEKLCLGQVRWKKVTQDPSWDPSHPMSWSEPLGETQWSICVPSDTEELENYAEYIVSYFTLEAKFTRLFKEITTHNFISVICTMKWLVVQRQQFHSAAKCWQSQGDKGAVIHPLLWERDHTVRMDPNSSKGAHQWTNSCFVSTKTGGGVLKGSNKRTLKHLGMGEIGYSPAHWSCAHNTVNTGICTLELHSLHMKSTALKLKKP